MKLILEQLFAGLELNFLKRAYRPSLHNYLAEHLIDFSGINLLADLLSITVW